VHLGALTTARTRGFRIQGITVQYASL